MISRSNFVVLALLAIPFVTAGWPPSAAADIAPVVYELRKPITEEKFQRVARRAYDRRQWTVTEINGKLAGATFERKGKVYKAEMELKTDTIVIRFLPGFADVRQNYLSNLRYEVEFELTHEC